MKKRNIISIYLSVFILIVVSTITNHTFALSGEQTINFEDDKMYDAIKKELTNYSYTDNGHNSITISNDELSKITTLNINNSNITNIKGIKYFTSLKELNISNNRIANINDLSYLTGLTTLRAYGTIISDISTISNLSDLEYLDISTNKLVDSNKNNSITKKLSSLVKLKYLDISHNSLKYTTGLNSLTNLEELYLYDNFIEEISGIKNLNKLEVLTLGENKQNITDLSNLNTLTNLKELDFSENKTNSILNNITNLTHLEILSLEDNQLTNISSLSNLTNLKELVLYNNSISDISPLLGLSNLEYLILGKNSLTNLNGIVSNNSLVWPHMKKLAINENNITKNSEIYFLCNLSRNQLIELDYEYITNTSGLPHIDSNGVKYVTYEDFGARSDGIYDDYIAIRNAHHYAEERSWNGEVVEIRGTTGKEYHIYKYYDKISSVVTSVDLNNATYFIHDEEIDTKSSRFEHLFTVSNQSYSDIKKINNPSWTINKNTKKLTNIENELNDLNAKGFNKYYVLFRNDNKKQFIRSGDLNGDSGDSQIDVAIIDSEGNLLNDIQWDFDELTYVEISPIPNETLYLKNINIVTNIPQKRSETNYTRGGNKEIFFNRNIQIHNSLNVEIDNFNHTMSEDSLGGSYFGIIYFNKAANTTIKNSYFYAKKYNVEGRSTYDIVMHKGVNVNFVNIESNNLTDTDRWGIMATNHSKDVTFDNVSLNHIDAHCGIYNLTVKNSEVGLYGVSVVGQGTLNVFDTNVYSEMVVRLKGDYGSFWNGTINISNVKLKYSKVWGSAIISLISYYIETDNGELHNYGYDLSLPTINVENLTIESDKHTEFYILPNWDTNTPALMNNYFDKNIYINGITFIYPNSRLILAKNNMNELTGNYVFTNLELTNKVGDLTHQFNIGEEITSYSDTYLKVSEQSSAKNNITIYKNNQKIIDNMEIKEEKTFSFTENGTYRVVLLSEENEYHKTGTKEFTITINKIKGDLNYNGKIDLPDIISILKRYLEIEPITADELANCDMDNDNKISLNDVIALLRLYLQIS